MTTWLSHDFHVTLTWPRDLHDHHVTITWPSCDSHDYHTTILDSHDCCISSAGDIVVRSLQTMFSVRYSRPFWRKLGKATLTTLCMNFTATYLRTWNETLMQYVSLCKSGLSRASVLHVVFFTVKFYLFVYEYYVSWSGHIWVLAVKSNQFSSSIERVWEQD